MMLKFKFYIGKEKRKKNNVNHVCHPTLNSNRRRKRNIVVKKKILNSQNGKIHIIHDTSSFVSHSFQ